MYVLPSFHVGLTVQEDQLALSYPTECSEIGSQTTGLTPMIFIYLLLFIYTDIYKQESHKAVMFARKKSLNIQHHNVKRTKFNFNFEVI